MENKIDKYWLNLDPNTFIFEGCSEFVLYNADFKTIVKIAKTETINRLMYGFLNVNNLYTLLVSDNDLDNPEINNFISILRQNFMGDVFYTAVTKPITIPPVMKCHSTLRGDIKNENLLSMLNELTFYINGSCDKECLHCSEYCKQFLSCHKNSGYLRFTDIKNIIINVTRIVPSLKINICGGNLSDYSDINDLVLFFRIKNINAHFYINYTNLTCDFVEKINSKNITLHVLVNFPVSNNILFDKIAFLGKVRCNIVYNFILTSDEDIVTLDKLSNCYSINNYQVIPFYTGNNLSFFHKYVYLSLDDLMADLPSKQQIHQKMIVNLNNFGKIIVSSTGHVYSNLNFPPLGHISKDTLPDLIEKEWNNGKSWKQIRNTKPCIECAFKYLCPSPSNYEYILKKPNLCHININEN